MFDDPRSSGSSEILSLEAAGFTEQKPQQLPEAPKVEAGVSTPDSVGTEVREIDQHVHEEIANLLTQFEQAEADFQSITAEGLSDAAKAELKALLDEMKVEQGNLDAELNRIRAELDTPAPEKKAEKAPEVKPESYSAAGRTFEKNSEVKYTIVSGPNKGQEKTYKVKDAAFGGGLVLYDPDNASKEFAVSAKAVQERVKGGTEPAASVNADVEALVRDYNAHVDDAEAAETPQPQAETKREKDRAYIRQEAQNMDQAVAPKVVAPKAVEAQPAPVAEPSVAAEPVAPVVESAPLAPESAKTKRKETDEEREARLLGKDLSSVVVEGFPSVRVQPEAFAAPAEAPVQEEKAPEAAPRPLTEEEASERQIPIRARLEQLQGKFPDVKDGKIVPFKTAEEREQARGEIEKAEELVRMNVAEMLRDDFAAQGIEDADKINVSYAAERITQELSRSGNMPEVQSLQADISRGAREQGVKLSDIQIESIVKLMVSALEAKNSPVQGSVDRLSSLAKERNTLIAERTRLEDAKPSVIAEKAKMKAEREAEAAVAKEKSSRSFFDRFAKKPKEAEAARPDAKLEKRTKRYAADLGRYMEKNFSSVKIGGKSIKEVFPVLAQSILSSVETTRRLPTSEALQATLRKALQEEVDGRDDITVRQMALDLSNALFSDKNLRSSVEKVFDRQVELQKIAENTQKETADDEE